MKLRFSLESLKKFSSNFILTGTSHAPVSNCHELQMSNVDFFSELATVSNIWDLRNLFIIQFNKLLKDFLFHNDQKKTLYKCFLL